MTARENGELSGQISDLIKGYVNSSWVHTGLRLQPRLSLMMFCVLHAHDTPKIFIGYSHKQKKNWKKCNWWYDAGINHPSGIYLMFSVVLIFYAFHAHHIALKLVKRDVKQIIRQKVR